MTVLDIVPFPANSVSAVSSTAEQRVPIVESTLSRIVILMRLLGWLWSVMLVVTTALGDGPANTAVLIGAVVLATVGAGLLFHAVRAGWLYKKWFAVLDGVIAFLLMAAGWIAGAGDFLAGGYPSSWLFVMAFATNLKWTFIASLVATFWFGLLHVLMGLPPIRTVGSIQFVVFALVAGWAFDAIRGMEKVRAQAVDDRSEVERELIREREEAARLKERTEIARELHDSVLQTLKLISSAADDADEVRYLTRVQERDLRRTINEYRSPHDDSLQARLLDVRAAVEDRYRVEIEHVIRQDTQMTPRLSALVEAAREAMNNAARHSGSPSIDLFADVNSQGVQINIRDRGCGFDPSSVGGGGLVDSVIARVEEVGGLVTIKSKRGVGTDVELFLPVDA